MGPSHLPFHLPPPLFLPFSRAQCWASRSGEVEIIWPTAPPYGSQAFWETVTSTARHCQHEGSPGAYRSPREGESGSAWDGSPTQLAMPLCSLSH